MPNLAYLLPAREDQLKRARANEYRRSLPHAVDFGQQAGKHFLSAGVINSLIAIAEVDSCAAGSLLAELTDAYATQVAKRMAEQDNGILKPMPPQKPLNFYVQHVHGFIRQTKGK